MKHEMSSGPVAQRSLPPRPNLDYLRNEAKQRLHTMRALQPTAQLSDAQYQLAREYGFTSWRDLKSEVDSQRSGEQTGKNAIVVGDWIGELSQEARIALHVRASDTGILHATLDSRDFGTFDMRVELFQADDSRMSFTVLLPSRQGRYEALYQGEWDDATRKWNGEWKAHGMSLGLSFERGVYTPAPIVHGIDGFWDGRVGGEHGARLALRVKTDEHGTFAWCDSPDRNLFEIPVRSISRDGQRVEFKMQTATVIGGLAEDGTHIDAKFARDGKETALALIRRLPGEKMPRSSEPPVVTVASDVLATYVGEFVYPSGIVIRFELDGDQLYAHWSGMHPKLPLYPSSQTDFFWRQIDASVNFEVAADGRVDSLVTRQNGRPLRAVRKS